MITMKLQQHRKIYFVVMQAIFVVICSVKDQDFSWQAGFQNHKARAAAAAPAPSTHRPPGTQKPISFTNESATNASCSSTGTNEDVFDKTLRACLVAPRRQLCFLSTIMTPAAPFHLADYEFDGSEAELFRWERIDGSRPLPLRQYGMLPLRNGSVVHVQTASLTDFRDHVLPRLRVRVVLIIGMWHIANSQRMQQFANVRCLQEILSNSWVIHVFMQNPELRHVDYTPLPFGLDFRKIEHLAILLPQFSTLKKNISWYSSFVTHSRDRVWRPLWWFRFGGRYESFAKHMKSFCSALFVGSPGGDRPDSYRHWEAIACHAVPVTTLNRTFFRPLFGDDVVYANTESDLRSLLKTFQSPTAAGSAYHKPNRDVLLISFWQNLIAKALKKEKGRPLQTRQEH
eukprot:TRINITY_DN9911_c0_g3_i3.p1 TRINITY_DN9911_c0_g3~~TRINITY_DN9911_c0_g3_i3.p1  ORF type:complete len:400 (-),score=42.89 TRINITY_DN9911_c0_g3_i3:92-1291(-)